jgi:hypothetical protein
MHRSGRSAALDFRNFFGGHSVMVAVRGRIMLPRFQSLEQTPEDGNFDYGQVFFQEKTSGGDRLVIGSKDGHVDLMEALCSNWPDGWYVLYILVVSRTGRKEGRYQSPLFDDFTAVQVFNGTHQTFLEGDGRHHYWIGTPSNAGLLVYDQHNVIFAYGDLDHYKGILRARGFREQEFWFPAPHQHHYHMINDQLEDELFAATDWEFHPLQEQDQWD